MTEISKSLLQLIRDEIDKSLFDLHTGLPAKVVTYDPDTQSCSVQITLKRYFLDTEGVPQPFDYPIISNVPIEYPAGGGWSLTFPLIEGDTVFLAFAERSLDRWLDAPDGDISDPLIARKHDLSDAVARPGLRPRGAALPFDGANLVLRNTDGTTTITLSEGSVTVDGAQVFLGGVTAIDPAVHGNALVAILTLVGTFAAGLVAACTPPAGTLDKSAVLPLATALAALTPLLAIPPGPGGLLSPKVIVE